MGVQKPEKAWSTSSLQQGQKQGKIGGNRVCVIIILSLVAHGAFLSLWITTTHNPARYLREVEEEVEEQLALPHSMTPQLPHWRATVDCSAFSLDCLVHGRISHRYRKYPFPPTADIDGFQATKLAEVPPRWIDTTKSPISNNLTRNDDRPYPLYIYPGVASIEERQRCLDFTQKDTMQQLHELLKDRIQPEPITGMVAFTVADIHYSEDMIHDIFQSFETIVGFSRSLFFVAAIDQATVELACKYNYPVLLWKEDKGNLKDAVANIKLVLSYELVQRDRPFFFAEMDVFWLQSPLSSLQAFMVSSEHDIIFSTHQNNARKPNIGVYAAKANEKTVEYFRSCMQVLAEKPKTHDQFVMVSFSNVVDVFGELTTRQNLFDLLLSSLLDSGERFVCVQV